jgi:hypothetical protein
MFHKGSPRNWGYEIRANLEAREAHEGRWEGHKKIICGLTSRENAVLRAGIAENWRRKENQRICTSIREWKAQELIIGRVC